MLDELKHPLAPKPVWQWTRNVPPWLEIAAPTSALLSDRLDTGESQAISLAIELQADVLLIDEQAGRQEALRSGLNVAGTISVLDEADQAGLIVFDDAIAELQRTSFRISQSVLREIRARRSG